MKNAEDLVLIGGHLSSEVENVLYGPGLTVVSVNEREVTRSSRLAQFRNLLSTAELVILVDECRSGALSPITLSLAAAGSIGRCPMVAVVACPPKHRLANDAEVVRLRTLVTAVVMVHTRRAVARFVKQLVSEFRRAPNTADRLKRAISELWDLERDHLHLDVKPDSSALPLDAGGIIELTREQKESIKESLTVAEVFVRYGLIERAVGELLDVLESFPFHIETREKLVTIYKDQEMSQEAADQLTEVARAYDKLGRASEASRARDEATQLRHPSRRAPEPGPAQRRGGAVGAPGPAAEDLDLSETVDASGKEDATGEEEATPIPVAGTHKHAHTGNDNDNDEGLAAEQEFDLPMLPDVGSGHEATTRVFEVESGASSTGIIPTTTDAAVDEEAEQHSIGLGVEPVGRGEIETHSASPELAPKETVLDLVHFTVTTPAAVGSGTFFLLYLWAHLDGQRAEVLDRAREVFSRRDLGIASRGPVRIARGSVLGASLRLDGFDVEEPNSELLWDGEIASMVFTVFAPSGLSPGRFPGNVTLHHCGVRVARVSFLVRVGPAVEGVLSSTATPHRRAFASYASPDRDEVLGRIQGMQKVVSSLEVFLDVASLRSGQRWEPELKRHIKASDVLYLFWSRAAKESPWVDKEWRLGLRLRGVDFIDPVPLISPEEVPPPSELRELHFNDWVLAYRRRSP
jgi:hypothetical protein